MEEKFKSFCAFGGGGATAVALMDGAKLAKLCRDVKLLDKNLTSTDVDIIFSKVKAKTERKINYKQFEEALKLMADKKYAGTDDGLQKLKAKILESGGPVTHGVTKVVKAGAVDRLTDVSKFTGSHKERFTEDGKGRGVAGRKDVADNAGYVTGFKGSSASSSSHAPSTGAGGKAAGSRPQSTSSDSGAKTVDGRHREPAERPNNEPANHAAAAAGNGHQGQPVVTENATSE